MQPSGGGSNEARLRALGIKLHTKLPKLLAKIASAACISRVESMRIRRGYAVFDSQTQNLQSREPAGDRDREHLDG
jgi:hypothetical protein